MRSLAVCCALNIRKMSSKKVAKTSLRDKLLKKNATACSSSPCVDIEDTLGVKVESDFFSPVQTRLQRRINSKPINMREVTNFKRTKSEAVNDVKIEVPKKVVKKKEVDAEEEKIVETKIEEAPVDAKWEPKDWETTLKNIRLMRATVLAPVDTMGCHQCSDEVVDNKTRRFHVLVSLMLSSQTKDETTFAAVQRLRSHSSLTPETVAPIEVTVLENLLKPVSFYKTKAKHLQLVSRILIDQYNSDIPATLAELMKLPGVGPKMAHLCMSEAWNEITGIGVDVHVHRIANRMKWLPKETKNPEQTRVALESWVPRTLWRDVNHLLVGFGQTFCTPVSPKCGLCLNQQTCPSAFAVKPKKATKVQPKKLLL